MRRRRTRETDISVAIALATPQDAIARFAAAVNSGQLDAVLAVYEPQAVLALPERMPARGRAAIGEGIRPFLERRLRVAYQPAGVVQAEHGLALATFGWTAEYEDGAGRLFGTTHVVLRRQADGGWLYAIHDPGFGIPPG